MATIRYTLMHEAGHLNGDLQFSLKRGPEI